MEEQAFFRTPMLYQGAKVNAASGTLSTDQKEVRERGGGGTKQ